MESHKCIYCLKEKPKSEFNREHVVSRFMGTYENAYVLSGYQVCKECNSYFCDNLENSLSFDSLEGYLRIENSQKIIKTDRDIGRTRLKFRISQGKLSGLAMYASSTSPNSGNLRLEIIPAIGIVSNNTASTYDFYSLNTIPVCDNSIQKRIAGCQNPIITFGYDESDVANALRAKGYDLSHATYTGNLDISDITGENSIEAQITCKVDNLLLRLALKNIFNFICYEYGKECSLRPEFDNLRNFVRYGTVEQPISAFFSDGGLKNIPGLTEKSHVIGLGWSVVGDQIYLCGYISWFSAITYTIALYPVRTELVNRLPELPVIICDNDKRTISSAKYLLAFDWPGNKKKIGFLNEDFQPINES